MPTFGSLFAGVGGFDLGFEAAGWECRWQVEWDKRCQSVLARYWPDVPRYGDVRGVTAICHHDWHKRNDAVPLAGGDAKEVIEPVDAISFGFP